MADNPYKRPLLVTVFAVIYLLIGLGIVIGSASILVGGEAMLIENDMEEYADIYAYIGAVSLIIGLVYLLISYGFLKGWSIIWYIGVLFSAFGIVMSAMSIIVTIAMVVPLVVFLVMLLYLFKDNVKLFFLKRRFD